MSKKCIYYVEGKCEEKLINALKLGQAKMVPGKVKIYNIIQKLVPKSQLLSISTGTTIALVFDTDQPNTDILRQNVEMIKRYCSRVRIVFLPQVMNFEDELVRSTDVGSVEEITKSKGLANFKSDFCKMKDLDCRNNLDRHHLDVQKLWVTTVPSEFSMVTLNSSIVKL